MTLPRVMLVEDDASIARFVQMALDELPMELVCCTNVPDALQTLQSEGVRLIITDLMLPGESGMELVQRLTCAPGPTAAVPVAVFSAGLTPAVREQLQALKVWRMLSKPASVSDLETCVRDALALPAGPLGSLAAPGSAAPSDLSTARAEAIATHFAGDAFLFEAYRSSCLQQFPADVRQGDAACANQDWQALRRLAHSLSTVLLTLGHPEQSRAARQLEDLAARDDAAECQAQWPALRALLARL